jgi:putative methyltransferase
VRRKTDVRQLTPILALLLSHDLLVSKSGVAAPAGHVLKLAITRHKARLGAEFTKTRIRYGHATLAAFKEAVANGELESDDDDALKATRHPRWVRINTVKTKLNAQLKTTFAGFEKTESLAEVRSARGTSKVYYQDPNISNLLALPSKINLSRTSAYTEGHIIFQDKASCFPACLLDLSPEDGDVIDGCAAPGNKTTHLAAIISTNSSEQQKVIAFERDKLRSTTLQKMVKLASAERIVSIKAESDFLAAKPYSDEFANVGAILLDPSCSGTGIVGRDDGIKIHLPVAKLGTAAPQGAGKNKKRKRGDDVTKEPEPETLDLDLHDSTPEETPSHGKLAERLDTLSNFQLHILTHAMRFPSAHKITYSTCSIHFEENEGVVFQALASSIAKQRGWKMLSRERQVEGMKSWEKRGVWEDEKIGTEVDESYKQDVLDACIRCDKGTDEGTMGFFVAAFVKDAVEEPARVGEEAMGEADEWNGFSGDDVEKQTEVTGPSTPASKKSRKKKRKVVAK